MCAVGDGLRSKSPAGVVSAGGVGLTSVTLQECPGDISPRASIGLQQEGWGKVQQWWRAQGGPTAVDLFPSLSHHSGLHRAPRVLGTLQMFSWCEGQPLPHGAGMGDPTPPCWVPVGSFGEPQLPLSAHGNAGTRDGGGQSAAATSSLYLGVQGGSLWRLKV